MTNPRWTCHEAVRSATVPTRVFSPGEIIFREGDDPKGEAFIVHIGEWKCRKRIGGEDKLVARARQGDFWRIRTVR